MAKSKKGGPLNVDRIKKLYKTGETKGNVAAVAKKVGRSYTGVRRQLVLAKLIK